MSDRPNCGRVIGAPIFTAPLSGPAGQGLVETRLFVPNNSVSCRRRTPRFFLSSGVAYRTSSSAKPEAA